MGCKGDVAIVTGAASGIGQAVAIELAKQGAQVVLVDLNSCQNTIEKFGEVHILVNNAGTCSRQNIETMTAEEWSRDIDTNLKAAFLFIQACVYPHMKEAGYGRIVNISSVSGMNGGVISGLDGTGRSGPAYAASKGGVIALTKWVAKELGAFGITCNSVAPGAVETAITKGVPYSTDGQVIKRIGVPEDIAQAVLYFASRESSYTTAQVLKVDGGIAIG